MATETTAERHTGQTTPLSFRMTSSGRSWDSGSKSGSEPVREWLKTLIADIELATKRLKEWINGQSN